MFSFEQSYPGHGDLRLQQRFSATDMLDAISICSLQLPLSLESLTTSGRMETTTVTIPATTVEILKIGTP